MAEKTQANLGFEKEIWDAACVLWGHIPAAEYRKVIIGRQESGEGRAQCIYLH